MRHFPLLLLTVASVPLILSCDSQPTQPNTDSSSPVLPDVVAATGAAATLNNFLSIPFDPDNFVRTVDNRFFPLTPGTRFVYKGEEDGEEETNITIVTHDRKNILGISAVVVLDRVFAGGELKEKTFDWYAQDRQGNVWYLGEDTKELEDGRVVSREGSWETGKNGARAGIIMLAHPKVGDSYRQEFLAGEAEDVARVVARGIAERVPYGSFHNCLRTAEVTRLEPGIKEAKIFCAGIGFVRAQGVQGPTTRLVLTDVTGSKR
jgi:hypothetical protein